MRSVTAALQSPSVGEAARLEVMHGHSSVQLQVSMYSPLICHVAMTAPSYGRECARPIWASGQFAQMVKSTIRPTSVTRKRGAGYAYGAIAIDKQRCAADGGQMPSTRTRRQQ
jgi:hypothetical protein